MLRLGIVGAGPWGRNLIRTVRALERSEEVSLGGAQEGAELVGVASRNVEIASALGPETKIYPAWRAMLDQAKLDGLIVATPPGAQVEIAREAITRGIPLLLEKPLALWRKDAENLADLAIQKNTPVLVDHIHLFNPAYRALKEKIRASGGEGEIAWIQSAGGNQGPYRAHLNALWDYGPHDLAMAIDLMAGAAPEVLSVAAEDYRQREDGNWQGNFAVKAQFAGGVPFEFRSGNLFAEKTRVLEVGMRNGESFVFDDLAPVKVISRQSGEVAFTPASPLTECVGHFVRGIRGERDALWGLALGAKVVGALEATEVYLQ